MKTTSIAAVVAALLALGPATAIAQAPGAPGALRQPRPITPVDPRGAPLGEDRFRVPPDRDQSFRVPPGEIPSRERSEQELGLPVMPSDPTGLSSTPSTLPGTGITSPPAGITTPPATLPGTGIASPPVGINTPPVTVPSTGLSTPPTGINTPPATVPSGR